MRYCIQHLNPGDTFQILGFTTQVYPCFEKPVPVNEANIAAALKYIEPLEGNGGTDILKATDYVLNIPNDPARARIICFMTDGYVGNDAQILKTIAEKSGPFKMFPFGVGNSVNRNLIDGMAREGRGVAEYVLLNEDGQTAAKRFYDRVATPLLVNIGVDWGNLPVADVLPGGIPDLYESGPIVLTGRYTKPAVGDITVTGMLGGRPWRKRVHLEFPKESTGGEGLPSLWARQRITEIESEAYKGPASGQQPKGAKEEITQLALEYRLMSQYTSFVAAEPKVVNIGGQQRTVDVPVEMADGVSYSGIFRGVTHQFAGGVANGLFYSATRALPSASLPSLTTSSTANIGGNVGIVGGAVGVASNAAGTSTNPGPLGRLAIGPEDAAAMQGATAPLGQTPEQQKKFYRLNKLSVPLNKLLEIWPVAGDAAPDQIPAGIEVKDGSVTVDIWAAKLKPELKTALLKKMAALGLLDVQELAPSEFIARIPVAKLDELLALPEILRVETPKFKA
jgi:Ca-activated chloride channel family protein